MIRFKSIEMTSIADIRKDYILETLLEKDILSNPHRQFDKWWQQAIDSRIEEVNAMTLATVSEEGWPRARTVLLKGYDDAGFIFFTNYESDKGNEIAYNPKLSLVFFWKELERQVRIEGIAEKLTDSANDEYFDSRPLESRIGAWASAQSRVIESREILENNFRVLTEKFQEEPVTRPPHWGGYLVKVRKFEFWQGRPGRLHDRILYTLQPDGEWKIERLSP